MFQSNSFSKCQSMYLKSSFGASCCLGCSAVQPWLGKPENTNQVAKSTRRGRGWGPTFIEWIFCRTIWSPLKGLPCSSSYIQAFLLSWSSGLLQEDSATCKQNHFLLLGGSGGKIQNLFVIGVKSCKEIKIIIDNAMAQNNNIPNTVCSIFTHILVHFLNHVSI